MSLISLSTVGIRRDLARPTSRTVAPADGATSPIGTFGQLLVAQIPSEALLAYTTLLAVFAAGGSNYRTGRWILYGAVVAVCPIVVITTYLARRTYGFIEPASSRPAPVVVATANPLDLVDDAPLDATATPAPVPVYRHLPILPALAATTSMAVYGLTVPGSALQYQVADVGFGIIAGCLAVGGGVMMAIISPFLARANTATADLGTEG